MFEIIIYVYTFFYVCEINMRARVCVRARAGAASSPLNSVLLITRFVIPVVFYEITDVVCVYLSNTTIFIGRI